MPTNLKIFFLSFFFWILSIKLFLFVSFRNEIWSIWIYSKSILEFYKNVYIFLYDLISLIGVSVTFLSSLFVVLLAYFYYTYFWVSYNKLDPNVKTKNKRHAVVGGIFTFLGFGCVACGQTLLYSFLLLLGSTVSTFLAPVIGQVSLVIGIVFLSFGIYKNLQLKNSPNVCKI